MNKRIIGAFAMILALVSFMSIQPANAAPLVDASARGSLSITKHAGDPLTQFGDPSNPLANTSREPLPGIEFSIQLIESFDLSTNSGWEALQAADISDFYAAGSRVGELEAPQTAVTDANGIAHFNDLPIGAYYVTETSDSAQRQGTTVARPFIVTIPTTNADSTSWNYDVAVQAKNQLLQVTEQANTQCVAADSPVTFGVSATIPAPDPEAGLARYEIYSPLPNVLQDPRDSEVYISIGSGAEERISLAEADYRVTFENGVVRLEILESGLAKIAQHRAGNPDAQITWIYTTTATTATSITKTSYLLVEGYPEFDSSQTYGVAGNEIKINACSAEETPEETPIPVPVPTPEYDPELFPGTTTSLPVQPTSPTEPTSRTVREVIRDLASTGANVLWVAALGAAAIILGVWLMRRNRDREE